MKGKHCFVGFLAVMLCMASCSKAPVGDQGAPGAAGDKGPKGNKGDKGDKGNQGDQGDAGATGPSAVFYSGWMLVDSSKWAFDPENDYNSWSYEYADKKGVLKTYNDTVIQFHVDLPAPKITQGILDSGVVYYFIKDSAGPGENNRLGNIISLPLNDGYDISATNRPAESPLRIFTGSYFKADTINLYLQWYGSGRAYDPDAYGYDPNSVTYKEMPPKTKFYIRYVTIPGGRVVNGRTAGQKPTKFKDYASLKAYYHIPD